MKRKWLTRILAILLALAMIAGTGFYLAYLFADSGSVAYAASPVIASEAWQSNPYTKLENLKTIIEQITENYKEKIDAQTLVDGAYQGVFDKLDAWSVYYASSVERDEFTSTLQNTNYSGVGLTITNEGKACVVSAVNPKGPCKPAGIKAGDIITHVNGNSVANWSLDKVSQALRGNAGTKVKITVNRSGQVLNFEVARMNLVTTDVDYYKIDDTQIGYICISAFNDNSASDCFDAKEALLEEGCTSFIVDLRDNPGGYMLEALNAASMCFLKPGDDLVYYYQKGIETEHYFVQGEDDTPRDKVVILVNENSASAAEVFTAAMKDNKAATIVGTNTFGKGVAQQIFENEDGSYFKLSTLYFVGPKKGNIDGKGIAPDYLVYNNGGLSKEEVSKIASNTIAMNEGKKYVKQGQAGLNVLAAQQRLIALGYSSVTANGILDAATMDALRDVQKIAGVGIYGGLDFTTIKVLDARFNAYLYGDTDAQLSKAIELLK